jgi:hypothetical protein
MKRKGKIYLTALMLCTAISANAQFSLSGEIRPRFEYRHGYKTVADSGQTAAAFTQQRTRLNVGYKTEGYEFKLVLQDVRVWGSVPQLVSNDGMFTTLHEAWVNAFLSKDWSFKFGRQEIIYDNHRIFGNVDWAQQARSHDAAIFKYNKDKLTADVGFTYNQDGAGLFGTQAYNGTYKAFQYLYAKYNVNDNLYTSLLFLNNGIQVSNFDSTYMDYVYKDNYSQTAGIFIQYNKDKLSATGWFYKQMGVFGDWSNSKIDAMNYCAEVKYKVIEPLQLSAGLEYLSGQSQTDTSKAYTDVKHAFNPFYGTNHKFNGFMDYFYVGNHINNVGLQDIYFKVKYTKKEKYFIGLDAHMFSAAANVLDQVEFAKTGEIKAMNKNFGTELDFTFGFDLSKGVNLKAGYSQMLATETLATVKGVTYTSGSDAGKGRVDQTNNWAWIMITVKPQFIKPEEKK